jgi:hypothetical protein
LIGSPRRAEGVARLSVAYPHRVAILNRRPIEGLGLTVPPTLLAVGDEVIE